MKHSINYLRRWRFGCLASGMALFMAFSMMFCQALPVQAADLSVKFTGTALNGSFGNAVSISGDGSIAVVGDDFPTGAVSVFTRTSTGWTDNRVMLNPVFSSAVKNLGTAVAINEDGDTILASSDYYSSNRVFVFRKNTAGGWDQQGILAPTGMYQDFGRKIAISKDGNTVIVGAKGYGDIINSNGLTDCKGAAYIFVFDGTNWVNQQILSGVSAYMGLGMNVALSEDGNTAVVTAGGNAVYVYKRSGTSWDAGVKLAPIGDINAQFGFSTGISGDTILVGVPGYGDSKGAVVAFDYDGTNWNQEQILPITDPLSVSFGDALFIMGDRAVVGASGYNDRQGAAWLLNRSAGVWGIQEKLTAFDGLANDMYGYNLSLGGDTLIVGASEKDPNGAAYFYRLAATAHTITATAGSGGAISPAGAVSVTAGTDQAFSITPDAGFHIADVLVDGSSVGAVAAYTFNSVTTGHTIAASFAANPTYTITVSSNNEAWGTASGGCTISPGQQITVTAQANTDYHFVNWTVEGTPVSTSSSYTFAPGGSVVLVANFAADVHEQSVQKQINGIEEYFEKGVTDGSITGTGKTEQSSANQLNAFNNMLKEAERLISEGKIPEAIVQLQSAYLKVDGNPNPPDFIADSPAKTQLAEMIKDLLEDLMTL